MAIKLSNANSDLTLKKGIDCEYNILVNPGPESPGLLINPKVHYQQDWGIPGVAVSGLDTYSEFDVVFNVKAIDGKVDQDHVKTVTEWLCSLKKPVEKAEKKQDEPEPIAPVTPPSKDPTG